MGSTSGMIDKGGAKRWVFLFRWKPAGAKGPGQAEGNGVGRALCRFPGRSPREGRGGASAARKRAEPD